MFSYVDLVQTEIALEVEERYEVTFTDEEIVGWQTLGDISLAVVAKSTIPTTETEVFGWVRDLILEGYGIKDELTPEEPVFADYDRMVRWFMTPPVGSNLSDRLFAKRQPEQPNTSDTKII